MRAEPYFASCFSNSGTIELYYEEEGFELFKHPKVDLYQIRCGITSSMDGLRWMRLCEVWSTKRTTSIRDRQSPIRYYAGGGRLMMYKPLFPPSGSAPVGPTYQPNPSPRFLSPPGHPLSRPRTNPNHHHSISIKFPTPKQRFPCSGPLQQNAIRRQCSEDVPMWICVAVFPLSPLR